MPILFAVLALVQAAAASPDERERWLPPLKTVTLPRAERSIGEILKAIREQSGEAVEASGVDEAAKLTVEWKDRPVLQALDDLCRSLGAGTVTVRQDGKGKLPLELDGAAALPAASCHWKQFRVEVADASITTVRSFEGVKRSAQITLRWMAQPGTNPLSVEGFQPEEIVDDAGWSLLESSERPHRRGSDEALQEGEDPLAVVTERGFDRGGREEIQVSLRAPAEEARTIERLRGRLFLTFPMKHVDLSVPSSELVGGKEIQLGGMTVQVVRFSQEGATATFVYKMSHRGAGHRFSSFPDFELLDEKGKRLNQGYSGGGSDEGYTLRYTLVRPDPVGALHLNAYVGRITLAIPVDLRKLPIPKK
jgi:hypothetical protein